MGSGDSNAAGLGRYTLLDRLGSGGMADVYLALSKGAFNATKLVVLKRPRASDHEYAAMFLDEARLAMRLNHPNVVQTYDVGIDDGAFFLAMEYLEGQPLHRIIHAMSARKRFLTHGQLARIVSDALAGLQYAHDLRDYDGTALHIVHRDVSPHNIFVTYDGQVKVVDFGIAKATMNQVQTETGAIKGKLAYMAPEHANAERVDRRSDVFAMGVILWELVARRRLMTGTSSAELLDNVLNMKIPPLSCEVPDVHPVLEAIAMRALQRDPRDRYQTALEMHDALESFITMTGQPVRAPQIGSAVDILFTGERDEMSARIRAHMQAAAKAGSPERGVIDMPAAVTSNMDLGAAGGDTHGPAVMTRPPRPRAEWRTTAALLVLAISIFALAVALVVTRHGSPSASPVATELPPSTAVAAAPPPQPRAEPTSAPEPVPVLVPTPSASVRPIASTTSPPNVGTAGAGARPPSSGRAPQATARPIETSFPR